MDMDGNVYFLGRADSQVKIRGFRVEPGEIENVINLRSDIAESVVLAQTNHLGEKHLVAYVTLSGADSQVDEREIKHYLSSRLPQHIIPAYIHIIDKFPMTQNGKINKKRLPSMVQNSQKQQMSLNASRSNYLQIILNVWKEQLGVASLQEDDSIYDYGASSLTIIVVQSKLNERFLCAIDPVELVNAQTPLEWTKIYEAQINRQCQASI
jgi:acyl carrier protein